MPVVYSHTPIYIASVVALESYNSIFFPLLAVTKGSLRKPCQIHVAVHIYTLTFCKLFLPPFLPTTPSPLPPLLLPPHLPVAPNRSVTIAVIPLNPRSFRVQWVPVISTNATFDNASITGYQVTTVTSDGTSRQFTVNNASASEYTFTGLSPYQYASDGDGVQWATTVRVVNSFGAGPNSTTARIILPRMCSSTVCHCIHMNTSACTHTHTHTHTHTQPVFDSVTHGTMWASIGAHGVSVTLLILESCATVSHCA